MDFWEEVYPQIQNFFYWKRLKDNTWYANYIEDNWNEHHVKQSILGIFNQYLDLVIIETNGYWKVCRIVMGKFPYEISLFIAIYSIKHKKSEEFNKDIKI